MYTYIYVYRSPLSSMAATLSALAENLKGHDSLPMRVRMSKMILVSPQLIKVSPERKHMAEVKRNESSKT